MNITELEPVDNYQESTQSHGDQLNLFFGSERFLTPLYVIVGIFGLVSAILWCQKELVRGKCVKLSKCCRLLCCWDNNDSYTTNDDSEPIRLLLFGFSFFDFASDVAWAVEVCALLGLSNGWAIGALLVVVIPYFTNLIAAAIFIRWLQENGEKQMRTDTWVNKHKGKLLLVVSLTGNGEPVLQLFNSKIWYVYIVCTFISMQIT